MPLLSLTLLGGFEARIGSKAVALPRKAQALLAYLALAPAPAHSRSKLAALLWGDTGDDDARNSLRQVLFRMRRAFGRTSGVLTLSGELVGLDQHALRSDVATFRRLVADGSDQALRSATELYAGKLLEGLDLGEPAFEEWLTSERERLHELAVGALLSLMARKEAQKATDGVIAAGLRLLGLDPSQEDAHRALMRAYASQGRRPAALRQYQICIDALQRELQTEPEAETKALYLELLRQPTPLTRAAAQVAATARPEKAGMSRLSLTGRDAELGALTGDLEHALAGTTCMAMVLGEAGVGKTRLVEELLAVAVSRGCIALQTRAYETEQGLPFALWVSALRSAGVLENRTLIEELGAEWRDPLNPLFHELPGRRRRGSVETENQLRLFEALCRLVATVAAAQPLVLVLEDLQWADVTSLRLLAFFGRRVRSARACVVMTARLEEAERGSVLSTVLSELQRDGRVTGVTLLPLTKPDTIRLIESLAPRARRPCSPEMVDHIWRMSEGNPFVVVEALRLASPGAWPESAADLPLPARVRQLILDRVDRLSPTARGLAAAAAVVGGEFEYPLLRRAAAIPDHEAAEGVEELVRRHIFRQLGEHFDFAHDRIREAVLGTFVGPQRRRLHLAVAAAIEETRAHDLEHHQLALAAHYREGEDWLRAIDCLRRASMLTAARGAFREAADLLEDALGLLAHLPRDRETLGRAVDVRVELWDRVLVLPDFRRGEECLLEALELATELTDERRAAFVAASLANHDVQARNLDRGRRLAEDALRVAERLKEEMTAARAANALGLIRYSSGDLEGAIDAFARGIKAAGEDPLTMFSVGVGLCHVHLRGWQGVLLAELGRFDDALRLAHEALDRAESVRNLFSMAFARYALARILLIRGDNDRALALLELGFEDVETYEIGLVRRMYVVWLTVAYAAVGRPDAALQMATQGPPLWPITHVARARALFAAGRASDADAAALEALAIARRVGEQTCETAALLLLAEIHSRPGAPPEPARSYCEAALKIAAPLGLRAYQVHCHRQLGELLAAAGQKHVARQQLAAALALYCDMGMARWTASTGAIIEELGGDSAPPLAS
jgi:DNA-binding SARP family transcriptional activator